MLPTNGDFIQRHAEATSLLHNVSVVHIITDENCSNTIEIVAKKINGVQTYIGYIKKTQNPLLKSIRFYKAYKKIIQQVGNFDVIHLNELFPFGLFTFLQKKPFIVSEHWTGYHKPQSKNIGFWQRYLSKKIAKKAHFICPVSNDLKNSMKQLGLYGNYKIVPNVVDTNMFFPSEKKAHSTFTILHISNMVDAHKNVSGIIKAVAKLNFEYQLILIGENSSKYTAVSDALNISKNIRFIEHLPHNEIPKYMQQANVYVSFSNYETWGIVMVEALACGVPVISSKTGILNELDTTEFATIIPINKENELTKAIESYKNTHFIYKEKAFKFVYDNFSPEKIAKQFTELYLKSMY